MPAWLWITALALAGLAVFVALGRRWWRVKWLLDWLLVLSVPRWWYSHRHAAHVLDEAEREFGPPGAYGSMSLTYEQALHHELPWWPAPPVDPEPWSSNSDWPIRRDVSGAPDWREQTRADLSPGALAAAGDWDRGEPVLVIPYDPGPGVPPSSLTVAPGPVTDLDGGPTVSGPEGAEGVNAPAVQPSRWLAGQLDILRAWSERQQVYAEVLA